MADEEKPSSSFGIWLFAAAVLLAVALVYGRGARPAPVQNVATPKPPSPRDLPPVPLSATVGPSASSSAQSPPASAASVTP